MGVAGGLLPPRLPAVLLPPRATEGARARKGIRNGGSQRALRGGPAVGLEGDPGAHTGQGEAMSRLKPNTGMEHVVSTGGHGRSGEGGVNGEDSIMDVECIELQ